MIQRYFLVIWALILCATCPIGVSFAGVRDAGETSESVEPCKVCFRWFVNVDLFSATIQKAQQPVPQTVIVEASAPTVTHEGGTYLATPYTITSVEEPNNDGQLLNRFRIGFQPTKYIPIAFGFSMLSIRYKDTIWGPSSSIAKIREWRRLHYELIPRPDIAYLLFRGVSENRFKPFVRLYILPVREKSKYSMALEAHRSTTTIEYLATKETWGEPRLYSPDARVVDYGRGNFWEYNLEFIYLVDWDYRVPGDPRGFFNVTISTRRGEVKFSNEVIPIEGEYIVGIGWGATFGK